MRSNKFNFTKAAITALPLPDRGRVTYYDANGKGHGLQLRVTPAGAKTFSVYRRTRNGSPERVTLGRFPDITVEQARHEAAKINALIVQGTNPAEIKRARKAETTFNDLFDDYLTRHSRLRKKTWLEDESNYRAYLAKPLGRKRLSVISRQDAAKIHNEITRAGHPIQANRVLALISSVFNWGISVSLVNVNPCIGIKKNAEHSRDRFLQADELPRFFTALLNEPNPTIRDYILISLLTGARRSNVLAMRWDEINFERMEWRIALTKNGTPQTVTLSPEAIQVLHNRQPLTGSSPFVFPGTGKSGHLEEPKKGWKRILTDAGITDLRIHDLRRTLGSWQARTGASLAIIGKSLNHKNQSTTAIYARLDTDPIRNSVNRATSAMLEAAGITSAPTPQQPARSNSKT